MSVRRPTIRDVASRAGVSIGTVSNVLTGRRPVRAATRAIVESAVRDLGFRPDIAARTLIGRRRQSRPRFGAGVPRLTCVGHVCADYSARVAVLPHRDDRLEAQSIEKTLGGRAANVAVTAASLGPPLALGVEVLSVLGDDPDSDWAVATLAERRVELAHGSRRPGARLSRCIIMAEPRGSRTIVNEPLQVSAEQLRAWLGHRLPAARHALFIQADQLAVLVPLLREARAKGLSLATQIGASDVRRLRREEVVGLIGRFDIVFVNEEAAQAIVGGTADLAARLIATLSGRMPANLVLTLGTGGAALFDLAGRRAAVPAPVVDIVDPTEAGDAFAGCFLAAWLNGREPIAALAMAVAGGSRSVPVAGAREHAPRAEPIVI